MPIVHGPQLLAHVDLVDQTTGVSQFGKSFESLLQWDKFALFLGGWIVAVTDVEGAGFLLLGTND